MDGCLTSYTTVIIWLVSMNHFRHLVDVTPVWKMSSSITGTQELFLKVCDGSPGSSFTTLFSLVHSYSDFHFQVTVVEQVLTYGGRNVPTWAFSEQLRQFCGIVAVGTEGGYVYLVGQWLFVPLQCLWCDNLWVSDHLSHCSVCGVITCGLVTICPIAVFVVW